MRTSLLLSLLALAGGQAALAADSSFSVTRFIAHHDGDTGDDEDLLPRRVAEGNVCVLSAKKSFEDLLKDPDVKQAIEQYRVVNHRPAVEVSAQIAESSVAPVTISLSVTAKNPNYRYGGEETRYIPTSSYAWERSRKKPGLFASKREREAYADAVAEEESESRAIANESQRAYADRKKYEDANRPVSVDLSARGEKGYKDLLAQGACEFPKDKVIAFLVEKSGKDTVDKAVALAQCQDQVQLWQKEYDAVRNKVSQLPDEWVSDIKSKLTLDTPRNTDTIEGCKAKVADLTARYSNYTESVHQIAEKRNVTVESLEVPLDPALKAAPAN
ncbi:MAG: hypothetical protein ACXVB9_05195 [Bdellovibrionota bacterium]